MNLLIKNKIIIIVTFKVTFKTMIHLQIDLYSERDHSVP